ncbi:MAG: hypothetical protein ATN33_01015 [Epulopiscium sp. Nele67-Bin001]|nr:MAG: hypothetical protein ATN33_01015 [Epulopiscium sp. Nele67-Bin001]
MSYMANDRLEAFLRPLPPPGVCNKCRRKPCNCKPHRVDIGNPCACEKPEPPVCERPEPPICEKLECTCKQTYRPKRKPLFNPELKPSDFLKPFYIFKPKRPKPNCHCELHCHCEEPCHCEELPCCKELPKPPKPPCHCEDKPKPPKPYCHCEERPCCKELLFCSFHSYSLCLESCCSMPVTFAVILTAGGTHLNFYFSKETTCTPNDKDLLQHYVSRLNRRAKNELSW